MSKFVWRHLLTTPKLESKILKALKKKCFSEKKLDLPTIPCKRIVNKVKKNRNCLSISPLGRLQTNAKYTNTKKQNHENTIKLFFSFLESQKCSREILKSLTKIIFLEFEKRQKIWNKKVFFLFPLQNFSKCALFFKNYISWDWSLGYTVRIDKQCCLTSPGSIRNIFPSARTW